MNTKETLTDMRAQILALDDWLQELEKRHNDAVVIAHIGVAQAALAKAHVRLSALLETAVSEPN